MKRISGTLLTIIATLSTLGDASEAGSDTAGQLECIALQHLWGSIRIYELENGALPATLDDLLIAQPGSDPYVTEERLLDSSGRRIEYIHGSKPTAFRLESTHRKLEVRGDHVQCESRDMTANNALEHRGTAVSDEEAT
jgi:hypothetical protein